MQLNATLLSFHVIPIYPTPAPAQKLEKKDPNGEKYLKVIIFSRF